MSNKRIQKKRAKADHLRTKSKIIANFVVMENPGLTRYEYRKLGLALWKLPEPDFHQLIGFSLRLRSPFRQMVPPRPLNWRPITSMSEVK